MRLELHIDVDLTWDDLCEIASEFMVDEETGEIFVYAWKDEG